MSYSTVYGFWPGSDRRAKLAELRNSWGSAPVVWNAMCGVGLLVATFLAERED